MGMKHAAVVAGLALALMSGVAKAAVIVDFQQIGSNVVATGSGSIDITGLRDRGGFFIDSGLNPTSVSYFSGNGQIGEAYQYVTSNESFGSGTMFTSGTTSTGDVFGFNTAPDIVYVPEGYVSGSSLAFTTVFANQTFASIGVTPGSYTYDISNGDSFTVNIVSAVPLPASAPMFGAALLGLASLGYAAKRKKAAAAA